MATSFYSVVKPSFEINFWLEHFRGMGYYEQRIYEEYIMNPVHGDLFFADQVNHDQAYDASECFGYNVIKVMEKIQRKQSVPSKSVNKEGNVSEVADISGWEGWEVSLSLSEDDEYDDEYDDEVIG